MRVQDDDHTHLRELLALNKEILQVKIDALEKATSLAKENMELRLVGFNEWRGESHDRESTFAKKAEVAQLTKLVYVGVGAVGVLEILLRFVQ